MVPLAKMADRPSRRNRLSSTDVFLYCAQRDDILTRKVYALKKGLIVFVVLLIVLAAIWAIATDRISHRLASYGKTLELRINKVEGSLRNMEYLLRKYRVPEITTPINSDKLSNRVKRHSRQPKRVLTTPHPQQIGIEISSRSVDTNRPRRHLSDYGELMNDVWGKLPDCDNRKDTPKQCYELGDMLRRCIRIMDTPAGVAHLMDAFGVRCTMIDIDGDLKLEIHSLEDLDKLADVFNLFQDSEVLDLIKIYDENFGGHLKGNNDTIPI